MTSPSVRKRERATAQRERSFASVTGEWESLVADNSGDENEDVAVQFCALAQTAAAADVRAILARAQGETSPVDLARGLAASIYNSFGRVQLLMGDEAAARINLGHALGLMFGETTVPVSEIEARRVEQARQLGILSVWAPDGECGGTYRAASALRSLAHLAPNDPQLTLALAERAQWCGDFRTAIQYWQKLIGQLGVLAPQVYYERLHHAYVAQGPFPTGSAAEELLQGGINKHRALEKLHAILQPDRYLEIGVQTGASLRLATCEAIGIDPMPIPSAPLAKNASLYTMSADAFFAVEADQRLTPPPGLVFIDGMHFFEFALRDFINVERYSGPETIVVIDDIYPNHPAQAARERRTRAWTGDVWKLHKILRELRPDLTLQTVDVSPTGLLLIMGLDPLNSVLSSRYDEIVARFMDIEHVPDEILKRRECCINTLDDLGAFLTESRRQS